MKKINLLIIAFAYLIKTKFYQVEYMSKIVIIIIIVLMSNFSINTCKAQLSVKMLTLGNLYDGGSCIIHYAACLSYQFVPATSVSPEEFNDGYGIAIISINNQNKVNLVFHRRIDSPLPIPYNFFIGSQVSHALGYDSVIIQQGSYNVDFSNYPQYGECTFNTKLVGQHYDGPTLSQWGIIILALLIISTAGWLLMRRRARLSV